MSGSVTLTPAQMLADAQAQYHKLMTGQQVVSVVDSNGERVQFTPAQRPDLIAYIQTLQAQVGQQQPPQCPPGAVPSQWQPGMGYYYGYASGVPCWGGYGPGPAGFLF